MTLLLVLLIIASMSNIIYIITVVLTKVPTDAPAADGKAADGKAADEMQYMYIYVYVCIYIYI